MRHMDKAFLSKKALISPTCTLKESQNRHPMYTQHNEVVTHIAMARTLYL